jgi:hypothetical protein
MAASAPTRCVLKSFARDPNNQDLYLQSNIFGNMIVALDKNPPESKWMVYDGPQKGQHYFVHGVGVHHGTEWAMTHRDTHQVSLSPFDAKAGPTPIQLWSIIPEAPDHIFPVGKGNVVLNVRGSSYPQGTEVIIWKRDNNPNSKWEIIRVH